MPALTDLKTRIRTRFFSRISTREDFEDANLVQAIRRALLEYSEFRPRRNVTTTVNVVAGQNYVALPANFSSATYGALYTVKTGTIPVTYSSYYYLSRVSVMDSVMHGSTYLPTWSNVWPGIIPAPLKIELTSLDTGNFGVLLAEAATANETRTLQYDAFHEISDSPDKNTVPAGDMHNIEDLTIAFLLEGLARDAFLSVRTMESGKSYVGEDYAKMADALILSVRQSMASFGA
jgi:hypothetical protein